jgi:hypothetical protein
LSTVLPLCALALMTLMAFAGTERLGRPMTDDERKRFGALLREHDYPGARLVALRFAFKLTRRIGRAQELMGRVDLRLVRFGWDPAEVALVRCLCRYVWSEWTHGVGGTEKARRAEEGFLRDLEATEGLAVPSVERRAVEVEVARASQARAAAQLEKLRAVFEAAGDAVNLEWIGHALAGETDLQKMAAASGRPVAEFYSAAARRKRAVRRLLGQAGGVDLDDKEPQ